VTFPNEPTLIEKFITTDMLAIIKFITSHFIDRMLQAAQDTMMINFNCVDPLGRTALLMAIDNENLEMVELLINHRVDTKDALLHAISEEFVEAVEVLLDHEDLSHRDGEPHVSLREI
jgi:transient receptor potential cation channel subfamily C member 4